VTQWLLLMHTCGWSSALGQCHTSGSTLLMCKLECPHRKQGLPARSWLQWLSPEMQGPHAPSIVLDNLLVDGHVMPALR
jgi:hypothetical protein